MRLYRDHSLDDLNTLRLPARAHYYVRAETRQQVIQASDFARRQGLPLLILGGGSNLVLTRDVPGLVLHIALRGVRSERRGAMQRLYVAAGEEWPDLVEYCLDMGWYGLENLSLIPGTAGAAPIQNIGAYGVELSERLRTVRGWHRDRREWQTLTVKQCRLGYRDSVFKGVLKDRFIITEIELELSRHFYPCLRYPVLRNALKGDVETLSARQVADAVMAIRRSKLPDPAELANAGSFFKNPVLTETQYRTLCERCPGTVIPFFPVEQGIKVPAAWLLEQAGWKGRRLGAVSMHDRQPLVLVNHGGASGTEVLSLAAAIRSDILQRYAIRLDIEPRLYP